MVMVDSRNITLSEALNEEEQAVFSSVTPETAFHDKGSVVCEGTSSEFYQYPLETEERFSVKHTEKTDRLLPTSVFRRVLGFLVYFGLAIPLLILMNKLYFGLKYVGRKKIKELSKKQRGFVVTCNHIHPMDCTWMGTLVSPRKMVYTSMEGNFKIPFVGPAIRFFDCVPINTTIKGLRNFMNEMTDAVKKGRVVGVYPEGGIELYCEHLRKFSDGAFAIAVDADAPVLPVVITQRESKGLWKLLGRKSCVTITVGTAVYPKDCGTHRKTVHKLRETVEIEMNHLLSISPNSNLV